MDIAPHLKPIAITLALMPMLAVVVLAQSVPVRHREGTVHGFLVIHTLDGKQIATGDLTQTVAGDRVTAHTVYHFKDGSIDDDLVVYSERDVFRLISEHHVQKGPSFPQPTDVSINAGSGQVKARYIDHGKEQMTTEHVDLPPDLANGLILTVLKNLDAKAGETKLTLLAATPKPKLVRIAITPEGEETFTAAGARHKAIRYVVKLELSGVAGVVAPIIGKRAPEVRVWILRGPAPSFLKSEGPFYEGGPVWRTELTTAMWPESPDSHPVR